MSIAVQLVYCPVCQKWRTRRSGKTTPEVIHCRQHMKKRQKTIGKKHIMKNGYVRIQTEKGWTYEHRYVWEQANGPIPKGYNIHHINGDKTDNRLSNLTLLPQKTHTTLESKKQHEKRNIGILPPIKHPNQKDFDKDYLIKLLQELRSIRAVARYLGVAHATICRNLRDLNINFTFDRHKRITTIV